MDTVEKLSAPEMDGFLTKQGAVRTNWKRRWFILASDFLFYYKTKKDTEPTGVIPVRGCVLGEPEEVGKRPHRFVLDLPTYLFLCLFFLSLMEFPVPRHILCTVIGT